MSRGILLSINILIFICAGSYSTSFAVPAAPVAFEITQPDGTVIAARAHGDEWNNWVETRHGYSIDKGFDGFWYYISRFDKDIPVLSNTPADRLPPAALQKRVRPLRQFMRPRGDRQILRFQGVSSSETTASAGAPSAVEPSSPAGGNILFILVEFTNRQGTYLEEDFAVFITNNIRDYFDKASYGAENLIPALESSGTANNGVIDWVNVGYPHPNTRSNTGIANQQLTKDAILAADPFIDYSSYDINSDGYVDADELAIVVIAAGYERAYYPYYPPNVWGHKWSLGAVGAPTVDKVIVGDYHDGAGGYAQFGEIHGTHQATMGIMVHELGHLIFGLPDLYDTDGSSEGIGEFGVMGSGSWGMSYSNANLGESPVLPCAWSKYALGWIAPSEEPGFASIVAAGSAAATGTNTAYKISTVLPNEYFLVENRQPEGYDRGYEIWFGANYGGLAIWHIDDNKSSNDIECHPPDDCSDNHYMVSLEQADGIWHLEKGINRGNVTDLWYLGNRSFFDEASTPDSTLYSGGPSNVIITNISAAGSPMTAVIGTDTTPPVPGTVTPSNTQHNNYVDSPFDVTADFMDNESDVTSCEYCVAADGACDTEPEWTGGVLSGAMPVWTCSAEGVTGGDEDTLTLNMRATSSGGMGTAAAVLRTVDASAPVTTDNSGEPEWTAEGTVAITLSPDDGTGSGIAGTQYCIDAANSCAPDTAGTSADVTCAAGSHCLQYVRYYSIDNVGNQEGVKSGNQVQQDLRVPADGAITATPGDGQVNLDWSGFSDSGSGLNVVDSYKLVYDTAGFPGAACTDGTEISAVTTEVNYLHAGLTNGSTYYYRICAIDAVGNISAGATISSTPAAEQYQLLTSVSPPAHGSIDPDCSAGCLFDEGTIVTLTAAEDSGYFFDFWENCDLPTNKVCTETMDADDSIAAHFQACLPPVRIAGSSPVYFATLQEAYDGALDGAVIQSRDVVFIDDLHADRAIAVTIDGGYDCDYSSVTGVTLFNGTMTISDGTVAVADFAFGN